MAATATSPRDAQPPAGGIARTAKGGRSARKQALFRAAAVFLGLLPLFACEITLRMLGLGKATDGNDPFVGFSEIHPLFVLNASTNRYEIPPSRLTHFQPESFAAHKPPHEFRIFVLGGSTVQGRPWSIETSFTTWLELNLTASDANRTYEVVNCGGVSYASYRLVPIMQEVLRYRPDLIIVCEGHNEFLEDRTYGPLKSPPVVLAWCHRCAAQWRTYNVLRSGANRLAAASPRRATEQGVASSDGPRVILGPEADARLDWKDGLAKYHRDEKWHAAVTRHFEFNLRRLAAIADRADVPLVLVSPVSNLQWAPFKPEHRSDITPADRRTFAALLAEARADFARDPAAAVELLQRAVEIDRQHAGAHYELGICLLELNRRQAAREAFVLAKDLDVCPLRMPEPLKQVIQTVALETDTPLVDADALIAAHSRSGFPDGQWLVDHVHPTVAGHQLIADALAARLVELGITPRAAAAEAARDRAYRRHLASLPDAYFSQGRDRLRGEQRWAHGMVQRAAAP